MSQPIPRLTEDEMLEAESHIPALAAKAGRAAYKRALATTGSVVVKTSKGDVVRRNADGTTVVLKTLPVGKRMKVGTILTRANPEFEG